MTSCWWTTRPWTSPWPSSRPSRGRRQSAVSRDLKNKLNHLEDMTILAKSEIPTSFRNCSFSCSCSCSCSCSWYFNFPQQLLYKNKNYSFWNLCTKRSYRHQSKNFETSLIKPVPSNTYANNDVFNLIIFMLLLYSKIVWILV